MKGGAIAGIVVASVVLVLAVVLLILFITRKWRRRKKEEDRNTRLDSIFRTIDKKLMQGKEPEQDQNVKFVKSKDLPELRIDVSEACDKTGPPDNVVENGNNNLGCDILESPIRRSANTYSEIDLGGDRNSLR